MERSDPLSMPAYELSEQGSGFSIITLTLLMELDLLCGETDDEDDEFVSLECCTSVLMMGVLSTEKPLEGFVVGVDGNTPENDILSMLSERFSSVRETIF